VSGGSDGIGLSEKVFQQLGKAGGVLNLGPVPALAKHVQLRARNLLR
jgi:hypothetical protein